MDTLEFDRFFPQFRAGNADDTCFYFASDPTQTWHYIGVFPNCARPFWAGLCDIAGGSDFDTAEELIDAPIYDGRSLRSRWDEVRIVSIWDRPLDNWMLANPIV